MKKLCAKIAAFVLLGGIAVSETVTVSISPGKNWKMKRAPQAAVWIEKTDGTFCKTLFVTSRAAQKSWIFAPKEGRPESLPVWYAATGFTPKKNTQNTNLDAVTSATPGEGTIIQQPFNFQNGEAYIIKAEFNHSFDYNNFWPKKAKRTDKNYSGVNGQPSIIYSAALVPEQGEIELKPAGTGSILGKDGTIHAELNTLSTAAEIISHIFVKIEK